MFQKPRAWNLQALQVYFQTIIATKDFIYFIYCLTFVTSHHCLKCEYCLTLKCIYLRLFGIVCSLTIWFSLQLLWYPFCVELLNKLPNSFGATSIDPPCTGRIRVGTCILLLSSCTEFLCYIAFILLRFFYPQCEIALMCSIIWNQLQLMPLKFWKFTQCSCDFLGLY